MQRYTLMDQGDTALSKAADGEYYRVEDVDKLMGELSAALLFYALPETYFAIAVIPDPPCGAFIEDFSETSMGPKPGKLAREVLGITD